MAEEKWGMVIDTRRCIGCHGCHVACKAENEVPLGVFRNHVRYYEKGEYPRTRRHFLPVLCNHCENPPCVRVCPTGASHKREDGIVLVDYDICIGCKTCMGACPYGARFIHPETKVADKCTFCVHRVDSGITPACTQTCIGKTRVFGDLNDPDSEVSKLVSTLPTTVLKAWAGTRPTVFYVAASTSGDEEVV